MIPAGAIFGMPTTAGTFDFTVQATNTVDYDSKKLSSTIAKGAGATVAAPTLASKTQNSVTINAVPAPSNGQTVEYAIYTTNSANAASLSWQVAFTGLDANTTYYIFARAVENANYLAGEALASLPVTTDRITSSPELAPANPLRAWIRNDQLHVTGLTIGETLSVYTATGALIYQSVTTSDEADIPLRAQGMYIVRHGDYTVRVVYQ